MHNQCHFRIDFKFLVLESEWRKCVNGRSQSWQHITTAIDFWNTAHTKHCHLTSIFEITKGQHTHFHLFLPQSKLTTSFSRYPFHLDANRRSAGTFTNFPASSEKNSNRTLPHSKWTNLPFLCSSNASTISISNVIGVSTPIPRASTRNAFLFLYSIDALHSHSF